MRIPLGPAFFQLLAFLVMTSPHTFAMQIEPNPNPSGNTITINPSAPGESLVPFSNLGTINIEALASFQNSSQFNNGSVDVLGGRVLNAGTIVDADRFNNHRLVTLLEGSQFNNLSSGSYYNGGGVTQVNGTFVNEGFVEHNSATFRISESGQYAQRLSPSALFAPNTVNRDMNFINAGTVRIIAGEFDNRPFGIYSQEATGKTNIGSLFSNTGGRVNNAGEILVGATGVYHQQPGSLVPSPLAGAVTLNTGTFANAGLTNIDTGVFENHGNVVNSGSMLVAEGARYSQSFLGSTLPVETIN
jgi:hypothetical protein